MSKGSRCRVSDFERYRNSPFWNRRQLDIVKWFNPHDPEHLQAYSFFMDNKIWPADFLPDNIKFSTSWQSDLSEKIADSRTVNR